MRNFSKITPEGTRDILFEECKAQRYIEQKLSERFILRGYNEVLTPGMEYFDVFQLSDVSIPQEQMYKTTDNNGRLIVLRPDSTLPIARMVSARMQNINRPIRLFYKQNIFRNAPDHSGKRNELPQMGVEILGAQGLKADLEAILLAAESLSLFVPDFRLEIGNAVFFNTLIGRLCVSDNEKEIIRANIETKNYAALDTLLDQMKPSETVKAMRMLPRLFGGEEILAEAEKYSTDEVITSMLEYMKKLYKTLSKTALKDKIIVDLGLVQRNDYYTGIIFSAYTAEYGDTILSGGRYDSLLEKFGDDMPAIGFSIETGALTSMALKSIAADEDGNSKTIVFAQPGYELTAHETVNQFVYEGCYCELSVFETLDETLKYAKENGFKRLIEAGKELKQTMLKGDAE